MFKVFRDEALQRAFECRGYAVVDLIRADECARLLDFWQSTTGDLEPMSFSNTSMSRDKDYRRRVHERVLAVLGPRIDELLDDYRVCLCSFNVKRPVDERGVVEWHQDWTFVDESRSQSVGVWCPLIDVDTRNGCLRVVPGSHRLNDHPRAFASNFAYSDLSDCFDREFAQPVQMRAGQALFYCQKLFHSSPPNRTSVPRVAAGALAIPAGAPLLFVTQRRAAGRELLVLRRVPDDFYVDYEYGTQTDCGFEIGTADAICEPLSRERLRSLLGDGHARASC